MPFLFRDQVVVTEGFYEGLSGQVTKEFEYSGTDASKVGTKDYQIKVTSYISVNETELDLVARVEPQESKRK